MLKVKEERLLDGVQQPRKPRKPSGEGKDIVLAFFSLWLQGADAVKGRRQKEKGATGDEVVG